MQTFQIPSVMIPCHSPEHCPCTIKLGLHGFKQGGRERGLGGDMATDLKPRPEVAHIRPVHPDSPGEIFDEWPHQTAKEAGKCISALFSEMSVNGYR